jgi:tetratricopeptide (TPR) repeat protein
MIPKILRHRRRVLAVLAALLAVAAGGGYALHRHRVGQHLRAAELELARFHYESAWQHASRAARLNWPERSEVCFLAARTARRAGHPEEAKVHLAAAEKLQGDTDEIRLEKQLLAVQMGEASEFLESTLHRRIGLDPEHRELIIEALIQGALLDVRLYQIKQLTDLWLETPSPDPRPYFWRGFAEQQFGGYMEDRAIADYAAAVERDPDYDEARERLADLLLKKGRVPESRPHFEALLQRRPDDVKAMVGVARCRMALGTIDAARDLLDRALARSSDDPDALRERGILALQDGKAEEAEPYLRRADAARTQDPETSYNLYICLQRLGREREAKEQQDRHEAVQADNRRLRQLLREYQDRPRDAELLHQIGAMYLATGNPDYELTGLNWLRKALEIDPRHKKTCAVLADFYQKKNMPEMSARLRRLAQ